MREIILQNQFYIESKSAKVIGKSGVEARTKELLTVFSNEICKTVLNADDEGFVVQWAIIKLSKEERDAAKEGK